MGDEQKWIEVAKRTPALVSGGITLATAVIGFLLLLQGNVALGITVLGVLTTALLLFALAYVAFARTPPLVEGGRGVYRFEKYRTWALLGLGLVIGVAVSTLLFKGSRDFVVSALTGQDVAAGAAGEGDGDDVEGAATVEQADATFAEDCFGAYFAGMGDGRVATLENGASAQIVLESDQTKGEAAGLYLTDFGRPVGAVTYHVFMESNLFRIESAVDGACRELQGHAGTSLPDANTMEMRLDGTVYLLSLVHDGGTVYAGFQEFTP